MLTALASETPASGSIVVRIERDDPTVSLGEFVDVDIVATFDDPIVAWGLDITVDVPAYTSWTLAEIGSAWNWPTSGSLDGDCLAEGVVFEPATMTVTPEPTTMVLLLASSLLVLRRRR